MRIICYVVVMIVGISSMSYWFLDVLDRELTKAPVEKNIEIPE